MTNEERARHRFRTGGLLLSACLTLAGLSACSDDGSASRPNIIFVFSDDHAAHAISAYGSKLNQTPNIDRLARSGLLFRNCFVTNSICAPSRAVILTGKHSHVNGVIDNAHEFDGTQQTFPKLLRESGYQTAMIGKWHLKSEPIGFDYWQVLIGQGTYYNPRTKTPAGVLQYTGYTTDILTDLTLNWLEQGRNPEKPFMLMFQHKAPHREWQPGPEHITLYDGEDIYEPPTLFDSYQGRTSAAGMQTMTIAKHLNALDLKLIPPRYLNPEQLQNFKAHYEPKNRAMREAELRGEELVRWKYQRYIKDYLRSVASIDDNLGRLLDYLEDSGLSENTVVIYSSDQGFFLGDHGWFDKRWMYEESLRMPLLVRWPGTVAAGAENNDLVQNLDFAATFLDIAGVKVPGDLQGRSLLPLLEGRSPSDWRDSIYYHYYEFPAWHDVRRHYGVRTQRHKLIHFYDIGEWELFDLERDPDELRSLYDDPAYAPVVEELKAELQRLRAEYGVGDFEEPTVPPEPSRIELEMVLKYDFEQADEARVVDQSGNGHEGSLEGGSIRIGSGGGILHLDGGGALSLQPVPALLDPTYKPLTVGAWCKPEDPEGVLISHGTGNFGYSLYLQNGTTHFAVRAGQQLFLVSGSARIRAGRWTHIAATLDAEGRLELRVDGRIVDRLEEGFFVSQNPRDVLSIGADLERYVGEYDSPMHFRGQLDDVRLYWGVLPEEALKAWATR